MKPPVYQVVIDPKAKQEIDLIIHYLVKNNSYKTASQVLVKLDEAINQLDLFPERCKAPENTFSDRSTVYHHIVHHHKKTYRVIYSITASEIRILHVVQGSWIPVEI